MHTSSITTTFVVKKLTIEANPPLSSIISRILDNGNFFFALTLHNPTLFYSVSFLLYLKRNNPQSLYNYS